MNNNINSYKDYFSLKNFNFKGIDFNAFEIITIRLVTEALEEKYQILYNDTELTIKKSELVELLRNHIIQLKSNDVKITKNCEI